MNDDFENRPQDLRRTPDAYIRIDELAKLLKILGALVSIIVSFFAVIRFADSYREYVDRKVENERTERVNADNEIRLQLYQRRR